MKHLDDVEQRLERAAQEVRQSAKHAVAPPLEGAARRPVPRGWLMFAAAFGVVILALGTIPLFSRSDAPEPPAGSTPTTAPIVTTTASDPVTTAHPTPVACSAGGMDVPADQDGLPARVAETRIAIAEAAIACDFATLESLASPDLVTSFGGGGFENIPIWEEEGSYPALALLVGLLDTPYATQDYEGLPRHYYWPSAFAYDSWEEIPPADMTALLTVYTQEELDQASAFGSYALWRIGITEDGEWRFFVAGD